MPKTDTSPTFATATLDELVVSALNVRAGVEADDDIEILVASIASLGLLQPLVVIQHPGVKHYDVVAGRRRLMALRLIAERGVIDSITVPIQIIAEANATEASLAENRARVQMTSVELYAAFKQLADENISNADIGRAFGFDEARVNRILRLSLLHPSIMKAWADGDIDEAKAVAFASTDDADLQDQVATKLLEANRGRWGWVNAHEIRTAIKRSIEGEEVTEALTDFVGADAYEAAGGKLTRDLFSDKVIIHDGALLTRLADDKIELEKAKDEARIERADGGDKNIEWVDAPPTINLYGYDQTDRDLQVFLEPPPLSEEAQQRQAEIEATLEAHNNGEDEMDDEAYEALSDELDALLEVDLSTGPLVIPAGKGKVLLTGKINHKGEWESQAFYENRDAAGLPPTAKSTTKTSTPTGTKSVAEQAKANLGTSRDGFMAMQVLFADRVAERIEDDAAFGRSTLGLDALLFGLAFGQRHMMDSYGLPKTRMAERGNIKVRDLSGASPVMFKSDWLEAGDMAEAWDLFQPWIASGNNRAELGARLLGVLWSPLAAGHMETTRPKFVRLVAEQVYDGEGSVGVAEEMPREKALDLMSHKARVALLNEWGLGDHAKGLKKGTSVDFCLKVINADAEQRKLWGIDEDTAAAIDAWLPSELTVEPVARPVKEPTPAPKAKAKPKAKAGKPVKKELADA